MFNHSERNEQLYETSRQGYDRISKADRDAMEQYCAAYMQFLDEARTDRLTVNAVVARAEKAGYRLYRPGMSVKTGDKLYAVNRGASVYLAQIGRRSLAEGVHMGAAHIDAPRIDIKENPLYEAGNLACFKTHYFGNMKKYQWQTIPLALYGTVILRNGERVEIAVGDREDDPVFCIPSLLVHLDRELDQTTVMSKVCPAEKMNLVVGSVPYPDDEGGDRIKLAVALWLHEHYGMTVDDFRTADLTVVPALQTREAGFDRSLICGYAQDDRAGVFAGLTPLLDQETPEFTSVCILYGRREAGNNGAASIKSRAIDTFLADLCEAQEVELHHCLANTRCLSVDAVFAYDHTFADVFDPQNDARINGGVGVSKYTGARGKDSGSEATAETMAYFCRIMDRGDVIWQSATQGKADVAEGAAATLELEHRNITCLDIGVPIISGHAPMELASKLDLYMTQKALRVFYAAAE